MTILIRGSRSMKRGFTLTELLIVVILLGILSALAVPSFIKTMAKEDERQARSMLQLIYAAERFYYVNNSTYTSIADPDDATEWQTKLNLDLPNVSGQTVLYEVPASTSTTFVARATRRGQQMMINQTGTISGSF